MTFSSWLRPWKSAVAGSLRSTARRPHKNRRSSPRLAVEALEDRTVPTTMSPLAPKSPLGSLVYESSGSGQVTAASPTDSFPLDLEAGQSLSVAVVPYMFGGHWYTLTSGALDWHQAEAEAVAQGGHLVTINSQAEQDFLNATFLSGANESRILWTGLNDEAVEGTFVWASGEPVSFTNWCAFEPNNGSGVEDYVTLNYHHANGIGETGLWNDEPLGGAGGGGLFGIIELPAGTLRPSVTVTGPGGPLATPPDAAPGDEVLLQGIPVTTAGTYTVSVAGAGGSTGRFQARVLVNGALEAEAVGGAENGTRGTAQDLDGGFGSVGSGRHAAVSGSLPTNRGVPLASDDFERASLGAGWSTYSSLSTGRIQLTNSYTPVVGGKSLVMDDSKTRGTPGLNEAVWTVNLAGQSQAALSFLHATWNDEVTAFAGPFTGHANADGIAISADGVNWYPAWTPPGQPVGVWYPYTVDLAAIAAQNGISLGSNFRIKFQQYGAEPLTNDGRGWDNLRVLVPDPASTTNEDWYRFTLGAGEAATVTATPQGNAVAHVQIYDANGVKLYDGDPAPTNVGEAVPFTAPTAGTYYARVRNDVYSASGVDYVLTVTAGAVFDLEDNSGPRPWAGGRFQALGTNQGAVGALQREPVTAFVPTGVGGLANPEKFVFRDGYLFVASLGTAQVMRYDAATGAPRPSAGNSGAVFATGTMTAPKGVAFGPDGNLYVGDHTNNAIYRFDGTTGAFLVTFVPRGTGGLDRPQGIVFDQAGNLYVSCNFSGLVLRFAPDGTPLPSAGNSGATFATGEGPEERDGMTFGPDGNLYVSSLGQARVLRFDGTTGAYLGQFVAPGSGGLSNASDVRFAADGTLYVTGFSAAAVFRYQGPFGPSPGAFLEVAVPNQPLLANLTCLGFGPDGALYVTNHIGHSVLRASFGTDFYRVSLQAGDVLTAHTTTPFGGSQLPGNNLDPVLRLYDSAGTLLASDDNGMSDLRNARLWYQSAAGGVYYVEVAPAVAGTSGEYVLKTAVYPGGSPLLVIDNDSLLEGNSGTTDAQFTVTLVNPPASGDVTVDFATADGTALAGDDYTATSGTLIFSAGGPTTQTITVPVTADQVSEAHEYFFVRLGNATGAPVAFDGQARATVLNEDTTLSVGAVASPSPTYWAGSGHYYTLTSATLNWQAAEAEAVALGGHLVTINSQPEEAFLDSTFISGVNNPPPYWLGLNDQAVEGTFVWSSGEPVTYTNWLPGEPNNQNDEDYAIIRVPPLGWNDAHGTDLYYGIIELPDFTPPGTDVTVVEGNSGTRSAMFTVTLSAASALPVSVRYATADGSATAASGDYVAAPLTTLTFAPGETSKTVTVVINGDTAREADETFFLNLSGPTNATLADPQAAVTILNDDATKFFVADDGSTDRTYRYNPSGVTVSNSTLAGGNTAPRGAASNASGTTVWVVDANKTVYVYNAGGDLLGSWAAGGLGSTAQVEGIAVDPNGTDVWLVDNKQDRVFQYTGAATRLSGTQNAASSFALASGNTSPKDIVTDGTSLWVVNDATTDKVFKYTLSGTSPGSWTIDSANAAPTGITLDPGDVRHLWIVDSGTDRVYQYSDAAGRTSGSQGASANFALASGNTNPQGIADPPTATAGLAATPNPAPGVAAYPAQEVLRGQLTPVATALRPEGGPVTGSPSTDFRPPTALQPLVHEAIAGWDATGPTAEPSALPRGLTIHLAELGGAYLGLVSGNAVRINDNAAGWGGSVGPTPRDDREFAAPGDQGEQGRMDLLTALMHEMGHILGLGHDGSGVMQDALPAGTRRNPSPEEAGPAPAFTGVTARPPAVNAAASTAGAGSSSRAVDAAFARLAERPLDWDALAVSLLLDREHHGRPGS